MSGAPFEVLRERLTAALARPDLAFVASGLAGRIRFQVGASALDLVLGDAGPVLAPAEGDAPERHQFQMYLEHLAALRRSGRLKGHTRLLEVSCGRGGGLAHLAARWPGSLEAVGLDLSENALRACRAAHGRLDTLTFMRGSALALPFADASFDVVLNVEASNDYGDFAGFFAEVHRVLRPGGVFLYCDSRREEDAVRVPQLLAQAGLHGEFRDITANVLEACRLDSARRRRLIEDRAPWILRTLLGKELRSYAGIEGSAKYEAFRSGRRTYVMVCAVKSAAQAKAVA